MESENVHTGWHTAINTGIIQERRGLDDGRHTHNLSAGWLSPDQLVKSLHLTEVIKIIMATGATVSDREGLEPCSFKWSTN